MVRSSTGIASNIYETKMLRLGVWKDDTNDPDADTVIDDDTSSND